MECKTTDPDFLIQEKFLSYFREGLKHKILSRHLYRETPLGKVLFQSNLQAGFSFPYLYIWNFPKPEVSSIHLITQTSAKQPNSSPSYLKQNLK